MNINWLIMKFVATLNFCILLIHCRKLLHSIFHLNNEFISNVFKCFLLFEIRDDFTFSISTESKIMNIQWRYSKSRFWCWMHKCRSFISLMKWKLNVSSYFFNFRYKQFQKLANKIAKHDWKRCTITDRSAVG